MCGHAIESNCLIAHHGRDGYPKLVKIDEWNRRADLAPAPVGYSREQMRDIFCEGAITRGDMAKCDQYLATLTLASEVPIPTVEELGLVICKVAKTKVQLMENGMIYVEPNIKEIAEAIHALLTKGRGGV
jgi:hypothetical protein